MLTHRVLSECLLSSLHLPQLVCRILSPGQTLQMTALSPRKTKQKSKHLNSYKHRCVEVRKRIIQKERQEKQEEIYYQFLQQGSRAFSPWQFPSIETHDYITSKVYYWDGSSVSWTTASWAIKDLHVINNKLTSIIKYNFVNKKDFEVLKRLTAYGNLMTSYHEVNI